MGAWLLVPGGWWAATRLGHEVAALASFGAAACLVWSVPLSRAVGAAQPWTRRRIAASGSGSQGHVWHVGLLMLLATAAGYALFVPWLVATWHAGRALGLAPEALGAPVAPLAGTPALWVAGVALAPLWEERLYRGHLLLALRSRVGAAAALVLTSALFALPHLAPWQMLGTFLAGLGLGALALACGGLAVPLGVHAGLNLAAVLGGVPPVRLAPSPAVGLALGAAALAVAVAASRRPSGAVTPAGLPAAEALRGAAP